MKVIDTAGPTVAEVFDFYLQKHSLPRGNEKSDRQNMRAPLAAFAERHARGIKDADAEVYALKRSKGDFGGRTVSPSTIRRELVALQAVLNYGSRKLMIPGRPTFQLPKPQESAPREKWITEEQQAEILSHINEADLAVRIFLRIGLTYGVRKGAIIDLHFGNQVNFITGTIDFNVPGKRATRKRRPVVPMTDNIRADLELRFAQRGEQSRVCDWNTPYHFTKFMRSIGYDWVTPHVMKHSAITLMLRSGEVPEDVAKLTSTDLRTIYKTYRHHTVEELKGIAEGRGI